MGVPYYITCVCWKGCNFWLILCYLSKVGIEKTNANNKINIKIDLLYLMMDNHSQTIPAAVNLFHLVLSIANYSIIYKVQQWCHCDSHHSLDCHRTERRCKSCCNQTSNSLQTPTPPPLPSWMATMQACGRRKHPKHNMHDAVREQEDGVQQCFPKYLKLWEQLLYNYECICNNNYHV